MTPEEHLHITRERDSDREYGTEADILDAEVRDERGVLRQRGRKIICRFHTDWSDGVFDGEITEAGEERLRR